MRSLKHIPYCEGHLDCMDPLDIFESADDIRDRICRIASISKVATVFDGSIPIAIVGMSVFRPGIAEVWSVTTEHIKIVGLKFHRLVRDLLDEQIRELKLFRVQMYVRTDFPEGKRWARALGFEFEGRLKKFGPDKTDCFLFARCVDG